MVRKIYVVLPFVEPSCIYFTNCALSLQIFFFIWQSRRIVVLAWSRGQWSFLSRCLFIWLAIIHSVTCSDDRCSVDRLIPSFIHFPHFHHSFSKLDFRFSNSNHSTFSCTSTSLYSGSPQMSIPQINVPIGYKCPECPAVKYSEDEMEVG